MKLVLTWGDVALRLALTLVAGILLGYNRSEHGKAAGMTTTVLVCLSASVAMIQANILLPTAGRPPGSFVSIDVMRLPLGILTGVGFIGAGAILRRSDTLVAGVTTAATLWLVTVVGLCLGGGQVALGLAATLLGMCVLLVLKAIERTLRSEHHASLEITATERGPGEEQIRRRLAGEGLRITAGRTRVSMSTDQRDFTFEVIYVGPSNQTQMPPVVDELAHADGIVALEWRTYS
jgi:putative Mg2+ transporter-C (MgtC) family protein